MGSYAESTIEEMLATLRNKVDKINRSMSTMQASTSTMLKDSVALNKQAHPMNTTSSWKDRPRWHDDGFDKGSRRHRVPKFHGEPHSSRVKDHDHHKVYEWLNGKEVSSKARKSSSPRHGGDDTSRRGIPPKKVDLSHPIRPTKAPLEWSSNFLTSKSLIQNSNRKIQNLECEDVDHVVKECVNPRVEFLGHGDKELNEDEEESTTKYEEELHPNPNNDITIEVESVEEWKSLEVLQILNTEPKPHEIANGNEHLRENQEKEEKRESESMLQKPIECEKR